MAQLIVRNLEEELVVRLKRRAADHGLSAEEEHRRILRRTLLSEGFVNALTAIPDVGTDDDFKRRDTAQRSVEL